MIVERNVSLKLKATVEALKFVHEREDEFLGQSDEVDACPSRSGSMKLDSARNQVICGDCIEVMRKIPDNSIDMCFADPPFNLKKKYSSYKDNKNFQEYIEWCKKLLDEMIRVLKPTGSLFTHQIPRILIYFGDYLSKKIYFRHWIAWDAMSVPLGKTLLPNHYGILYYVKSDMYKFYDVRMPHERCEACNELIADYGGKKNQVHPFGTLVSDIWTDIHRIKHNKRSLDPFVGTGTTAIAAKRLGRKYIGIDIDDQYTEMSKKKLEKVTPTIINEILPNDK